MQLSFDIAKRYLIRKKSTNVINIVTGVSIFGIAVGTAALVLILSVFNGFENLLSGQFNAFNPDYKISPVNGKYFNIDSSQIKKIENIVGVQSVSRVLEEVALFEYKGTQEIGIIKGVDENFKKVIFLDSFMMSGKYRTRFESIKYGVVGLGMKVKLNVNINDRLNPITVYMFSRKKRLVGTNDFNSSDFYPSGIFSVKSDTDAEYIITSLPFAEDLIGISGKYTGLEIKTDSGIDQDLFRAALINIISQDIIIKDKFEQDETFLKIMNIEKWVSYLIVSMTLLLVVFNLLVCLWMIVLDKKKDIAVLKSFGLENKGVVRIFLNIGLMISILGMALGFIIALVLYYFQSNYGLISVGEGFMITAYPIKLKFFDFIVVGLTVLVLSMMASIMPSIKAGNVPVNFNQ